MKDIPVIANNPAMEGICAMIPDVEFACPDGISLKMQLLVPMKPEQGEPRRHPCIVFVQGSSWVKPNQYFEIPQLSEYARAGCVVATVTHRSCFEAPFPAFLLDVKSAIRFLRANADEYGIDPERVAIWGTSSGGNAALLAGLTAGVPELEPEVWPGVSSAVCAVVDCFGPTDLYRMATVQYAPVPGDENPNAKPRIFEALAGHPLALEDEASLSVLRDISPVSYVRPGLTLPPFLILHGDADPIVLYEDSLALYEKLLECGYDAQMIRVAGAPHEGSFWSREVHARIAAFLRERL